MTSSTAPRPPCPSSTASWPWSWRSRPRTARASSVERRGQHEGEGHGGPGGLRADVRLVLHARGHEVERATQAPVVGDPPLLARGQVDAEAQIALANLVAVIVVDGQLSGQQ